MLPAVLLFSKASSYLRQRDALSAEAWLYGCMFRAPSIPRISLTGLERDLGLHNVFGNLRGGPLALPHADRRNSNRRPLLTYWRHLQTASRAATPLVGNFASSCRVVSFPTVLYARTLLRPPSIWPMNLVEPIKLDQPERLVRTQIKKLLFKTDSSPTGAHVEPVGLNQRRLLV